MLANPPVRRRWLRPQLTPTRITTTLVVLLLALLWGRLLVQEVLVAAYLVLVAATVVLVRAMHAEPGSWLSRRAVRRIHRGRDQLRAEPWLQRVAKLDHDGSSTGDSDEVAAAPAADAR